MAIAWTQQLFRIRDRFWPLPRCISMQLTRRLWWHSSPSLVFIKLLRCQHQPCEVAEKFASRNWRCHLASVAKDAAWALHSASKNEFWCRVGEADCIFIEVEIRWLEVYSQRCVKPPAPTNSLSLQEVLGHIVLKLQDLRVFRFLSCLSKSLILHFRKVLLNWEMHPVKRRFKIWK